LPPSLVTCRQEEASLKSCSSRTPSHNSLPFLGGARRCAVGILGSQKSCIEQAGFRYEYASQAFAIGTTIIYRGKGSLKPRKTAARIAGTVPVKRGSIEATTSHQTLRPLWTEHERDPKLQPKSKLFNVDACRLCFYLSIPSLSGAVLL